MLDFSKMKEIGVLSDTQVISLLNSKHLSVTEDTEKIPIMFTGKIKNYIFTEELTPCIVNGKFARKIGNSFLCEDRYKEAETILHNFNAWGGVSRIFVCEEDNNFPVLFILGELAIFVAPLVPFTPVDVKI